MLEQTYVYLSILRVSIARLHQKKNLHKCTASAGRKESRREEVEGSKGLGRGTIRDKLSEDHPDHGARSAPQPKGQEERKPLDKQVGWYRHQRLR